MLRIKGFLCWIKEQLVRHEIITKDRWHRYITFKYYIGKGHGEFSWIESYVKNFFYIAAGSYVAGGFLNSADWGSWFLVVGFVVYALFLVFCYFFGRYVDRKGFFKVEQAWGYNAERNVNFDDIQEIKSLLKELKV